MASEKESDQSGRIMFQPISHPVLRSVDPVKVAKFLRERERYETEISEKSKEVPGLTKASFKASVYPGLLRRMHFLGRFKTIAKNVRYENLTDDHISKWIKSLVDREGQHFDPVLIEKTLASLRVPMNISDPEARMMEYANEFFSRMESIGYDNFKDVNPKKTVTLLQRHLYPPRFKEAIQTMIEYHEDLKKDVIKFIEVICEEAKAYEKYGGRPTKRVNIKK